VGMEDGVFPHYRSMTDTAELEEERRLAYVGITRAQERLYLTHAWSRTLFGQESYNPPSRFLGEIPRELLDVRESEGAMPRRRPRFGERRGARPGAQGHTVIGLPGTSGAVRVGGGAVTTWTAPQPAAAVREVPAIREGDTVLHERFGEGVVLSVSGRGEDTEARVAFSGSGEKSLLLAYAPLTKVG
jgi:DNA helicase II / ATP-dependent DNA helicase PcrA